MLQMVSSLYYFIAGGLILIGLIGFGILATRRKYRSKGIELPQNENIEHYTEIRDEVTVRKPKVKKVKDEETSTGFSVTSLLGTLIGLGVMMIVGITLMNTISSVLCEDTQYNTSNSISPALIGTCTDGHMQGGMFSIMFLIIPIIGVLYIMLKVFGVIR